MFDRFFRRNGDYFYFVFRILIGFMFFCHGAQKLLGWFGDKDPSAAFTLMWFVGLIELLAGLAVFFGFFTRLAAAGSAVLMLIAYFVAHSTPLFPPIVNRGELAIMYFAAFLVLTAYGNKKWSLEQALLKKEVF